MPTGKASSDQYRVPQSETQTYFGELSNYFRLTLSIQGVRKEDQITGDFYAVA